MSRVCVCWCELELLRGSAASPFLGPAGVRSACVTPTAAYALVSHRGAYALVSRRAQADNVIPDTCTITGTIRDLDDKVFALIVKRITGVS